MPHSTLSIGDRLGPYEIVSLLGKGGMGEVYRAHDSRLGRDVAIKTSVQRFNERFEREARAIAALNHPNICQVYDVGPDHIVMELVEGASPKGPLPLDEALRIAGQIAAALEAAHEKGIVHRDLKPGNIKITPGGLVKVLDFGLAKVVGDTPADAATITMGVTEEGTAVGTPAYMAPEQAEGKPVDKRADVWAFGVVLFELVTGQRPFTGDSVQATLAAVLGKEPDIEKAPARVRRLLRACLAKDRAERLSSIGDWRLLLDSGVAATSTPARARWVPWAAAAAGLTLGLFGLLRFKSAPPAPPALVRFGVPIPGGVALNATLALSPDGRNLAISATEDGRFRLRTRSLDELDARLLPGTDGARFPFWSPDGRQIGFFADGNLKTIRAAGGEPAVVTSVGSTILGATWARDGVIVFSQERQLFKVNDKGGTPELLYKPESGIPFGPASLPDGRHFLYATNSSGVYLGSLDGAPPVRLLPDASATVYSPDGYLLFARQSRLTAQRFDVRTLALTGEAVPVTRESVVNELLAPALSAGAGGALVYVPQLPEQLVWVNRTGALLEKVGSAQGWRTFRLSPDQTRLAFDFSTQGTDSSFEIAILDLRRGTREQFTTEGKGALIPVFAPDGKQVAFSSNRTGRFNPFIISAPNQEHLVQDLGLKGGFPVDWSPDGKNLLWWGDEDLWLVPVDGGKPYTVTSSRFGETAGTFSPDGRWIAYASNESGRYEIHLAPFPADGGRRYTVSSQGGASPAWRRDGQELFYVSGDGRLTAVPVTIRGGEVQFGQAETLFPVNSSYFSRAYEPSLDGQRFLVTAPATAGGASATVLLNWTQTLTK